MMFKYRRPMIALAAAGIIAARIVGAGAAQATEASPTEETVELHFTGFDVARAAKNGYDVRTDASGWQYAVPTGTPLGSTAGAGFKYWNALGHCLVAGHLDFDSPERTNARPNMTRMLFLDAHTRELYTRWQEEAVRAVSSLRVLGGKNPEDAELTALVGELTVKSPDFGKLWAKHPVENCVSDVKSFRHPEVGEFDLNFEVLTPPDDSGHRVLMYTPDAGSAAAGALELLGRGIEERVTSFMPSTN